MVLRRLDVVFIEATKIPDRRKRRFTGGNETNEGGRVTRCAEGRERKAKIKGGGRVQN